MLGAHGAVASVLEQLEHPAVRVAHAVRDEPIALGQATLEAERRQRVVDVGGAAEDTAERGVWSEAQRDTQAGRDGGRGERVEGRGEIAEGSRGAHGSSTSHSSTAPILHLQNHSR